MIRKAHRYLGLFLGIQFLFWTLSGLYFSWTDIDDIHGDQFKSRFDAQFDIEYFKGFDGFNEVKKIRTLELVAIGDRPFFWLNDSILVNVETGVSKSYVTESEAIHIAQNNLRAGLEVLSIVKLDSVGPHHEYRGRPLPAYEISYKTPENLKAYVAVSSGKFQTVRHRSWRWFDFLWMTHTMDYEGRDNFNTALLRFFSLAGLVTVLSGFVLWAATSPRMRKMWSKLKG